MSYANGRKYSTWFHHFKLCANVSPQEGEKMDRVSKGNFSSNAAQHVTAIPHCNTIERVPFFPCLLLPLALSLPFHFPRLWYSSEKESISQDGLIPTRSITEVGKLHLQDTFLPVELTSGLTTVTDGHPLCRAAPGESEEDALPTGFTDIY